MNIDNAIDRENRLRAAAFPILEQTNQQEKSIKESNESAFTFQKDGSSIKSSSICKGSFKDFNTSFQPKIASPQPGFQKTTAYKESPNVQFKIANRQVLKASRQAQDKRSDSKSISSRGSSSPNERSPSFVKRNPIITGGSFKIEKINSSHMPQKPISFNSGYKSMLNMEESQTQQESQPQPAVFKPKKGKMSISSQNSVIHSVKAHK
mmetsp:Transcript_16659/g.19278  ORF Transcript_16659/g.19278 Transcript_16659/m.19278 type:complete len:208 (-) Transcript_16659:223-846(-)